MDQAAATQGHGSEFFRMTSTLPASMGEAAGRGGIPKSCESESNYHFILTRREMTGQSTQHAPYFCYRGPDSGWEMLPDYIQYMLQTTDTRCVFHNARRRNGVYGYKKKWFSDLQDTYPPKEYLINYRVQYEGAGSKTKILTIFQRQIFFASGELCEVRKQWTPPDNKEIGLWGKATTQ